MHYLIWYARNKGEKGANFQFDLYEVMAQKGGKICCVGSARCSLCENVSKKREERIFFRKIPRTISRHILGNGLEAAYSKANVGSFSNAINLF